MRIFVIGSGGDYRDGGNAASIHTREIANNLSKFYEVEVLYVSSKKIEDPHTVNKITVFQYLKNGILRFIYYYVLLPFYFAFRFVKSSDLIVYCRFGALSFATILGAKVSGKKVILEMNGLKADEMKLIAKNNFFDIVRTSALSLLEQIVFNGSDGIVAVTQGIKDAIEKKYQIDEQLIQVIPNGVNAEIYKPIPEAKKRLGLSERLRYICFVGNLAPWQGVEHIIATAPLVVQKFPEARFLIVGDGTEMNKLKMLTGDAGMQKYVIFTGRVPYSKTPEYISASEFCLAPWILERNSEIGLSPLKLYSYLAVGKPVIASKISGVYEEIKKFELGSIVDPKNKNKFSKVIIEYLQGDIKKEKNFDSLRRFVLDNYTWEKSALQIKSFISELLRSKEK